MFQSQKTQQLDSQFYQDREKILSLYAQLADLLRQDASEEVHEVAFRIDQYLPEMKKLEFQAFALKLTRLQHELSWAYTRVHGKRVPGTKEKEIRKQIEELSFPISNRAVLGLRS